MTLEHRYDAFGNTSVITTECALCGAPIGDQQGLSDHLGGKEPCPARDVFAEIGALDLPESQLTQRVQTALDASETEDVAEADTDPALVADGGTTRSCDHHEDRDATEVYEDGSAWCPECHLENLDAAAAARRSDQ